MRAEEDWREALALGFCLQVLLKKPFVAELLSRLPPESRNDLPLPNEIEAQAFDLSGCLLRLPLLFQGNTSGRSFFYFGHGAPEGLPASGAAWDG